MRHASRRSPVEAWRRWLAWTAIGVSIGLSVPLWAYVAAGKSIDLRGEELIYLAPAGVASLIAIVLDDRDAATASHRMEDAALLLAWLSLLNLIAVGVLTG